MKRFLITAAVATAIATSAVASVNAPDADGYCTRAVMMYDDDNFIGCIDQLTQMRRCNPTAEQTEIADYYIALANARLAKADAPALLRSFARRYPTSPRTPRILLALGELQVDSGNYIEALITLSAINPKALDNDSRAALAYNKAFCLLRQGRNEQAAPLLMEAGAASPAKYLNDSRFYLAYIDYCNGDYDKAFKTFRSLNTSKAPADMADFYLAQIYFMRNDYNQAAMTARRLLSLKGVEPSFRYEAMRIAGESLYNLGNESEAIKLLSEYAAGVAQPQPSALYILGVADYRAGHYAEAITALTPVAPLDNAMGQSANLYIGQSLMQQSNYSAAMLAFEKAFSTDFDSDVKETAFYNYAVAKTEGGRVPFGSSVTTFEQFLKLFPNSRYAPEVGSYIVNGYMTDDNYPAALASINAIKNPSDEILAAKQQVLYTLGAREVAATRFADARTHLSEAATLARFNPSTAAETQLWLGEANYALGDYAAAAKCFENYLADDNASDANIITARYNLGYARFKNEDYPAARDAFTDYVAAPGPNATVTIVADAWNRIGDTYFITSDFANASDAYAKAYTVDPATADYALYQEALMKGFRRDYKGKVESIGRLIKQFPSSSLMPQALLELGESYDQLGRADKTIETYSTVATRYPQSQPGRQAAILLAMAYLNSGDRQRAETTYRNLIATAPASTEAKRALADLKQLLAMEGRLTEYNKIAATVPGATEIQGDELDNLTYAAAERDYLDNGTTGRLNDYLAKFDNGISRPDALAYVIEANATAGNYNAVIDLANELLERYPEHARAAIVLRDKADAEAATGRGNAALESYTRLETIASSPELINEARLGVLRTARDLGLTDRTIAAATALAASSTITAEQRAEARFSTAMALAQNGDNAAAAEIWSDLAQNTDDIYGAKSAFYLADNLFHQGNLADAKAAAERFVGSGTPHNYWLARGFILLSDINRAQGNDYEAEYYLEALRKNYPGNETDIFNLIDSRLNKNK